MSTKAILDGLATAIEGMCPAGAAQEHLARAREMIAAMPDDETPAKAKRKLIYCGGGIAATLDAFLLYQLGHEDIAVYDASMNEWAKDESLPMEVG
jgi:thiosulfate/3-mercaptopyruvate sulfurtransferase